MKRFIILTLCLILVTGVFAFAEEGIIRFTYESALETAVENSIQPELDDYNIKAMESALEEAREEAIKGFYGGTPQEVAERKIIKEVAPFEAEVNLEIAIRQKADNIKQIKADVYQEMMRVLLAEESIEIKKKRIELLEEKYQIDLKRFQEGLISEADITDQELALSVERLELKNMETALASDILNIKQRLHVDLSEDNKIKFDYKLQKIGTHYLITSFNLEDAILKAMDGNTLVYQKQKALEAAEMKLEITKQHLKPGHDYYDRKVYEFEKAKKELYDAQTDLEVSIRNAYNELMTASDALDLAYKREELERSRLETLKIRYDAGVISRRDMIDSELGLLAKKQATLEAVCDFNIKNDILRNLIENQVE
ncbi:MAG: TolC family protein [Clostridiaceae bacterium]|nr:TolC family protein [Clostridiaceae bacterium]